jgi:predicted alpha/beta superfamily hydrolase
MTPMSAQNIHVSSGRVERHADFPSQFVTPRNVDVWLPDGYTPKKKYAVLYMHDGQMLYDATTTWNKQEWEVDETAGKLIKTGAIRDCIVVGIWNIPDMRRSNYFPAKATSYIDQVYLDSLKSIEWNNALPTSDAYLSFIVRELKPFIDKTYSTHTDKANTFIGGSSMGGLISLYAICEYPAVFGGAICISTHWPGSLQVQGTEIPEALLKYFRKHLPNPRSHKIYFDHGTETLDKAYQSFQEVMDKNMRKRGYDKDHWMSKVFKDADHSEISWAARLEIPLVFMLAP